MRCRHCNKEEAFFCEQCFQDLVAQNLKLQVRINELEKQLEYQPKHMKEEWHKEWNKHIPIIDDTCWAEKGE